MKSGPLFFLGIFGALGLSWLALIVGTDEQLGHLKPYYDQGDSQGYPAGFPGEAAEGLQVYRSLECAACHTQQVRRPDFGSDHARGWGDRQSVARDYIFQDPVQLGQSRIGPDLADFGGRKPAPPSADELMALLYTGRGCMPAYRFLFDRHPVVGQRSDDALLPLSPALRTPRGWEIVPSRDAKLLVAYLLNLNTGYEYPETRPPAPAKAAAPKAPPPKGGAIKEAAHK